jgi:hypothetical protein
MTDRTQTALAATQSIRRSRGYTSLPPHERAALERDLARIDDALLGHGERQQRVANYGAADPYALPLETPNDLRAGAWVGPRSSVPVRPNPTPPPPPPPPSPTRPSATEALGERARRALDAVDFPSFVAGLLQGTFQAIVDATTQQVREYAQLVADLSKSLDEFTRDNVSENQARDFLVERHGRDLALQLPAPGAPGTPRVIPRERGESSPEWLAEYELEGESLTPELVEGPLLQAGRRMLGEQRMQTLATLVLMGVNRIVVDDGQLKAKLQFHARARETTTAEISGQAGARQIGIAGRQNSMQSGISTMVSTMDVNAQSEVSIKTDLVGEVSVRFRTETFDINRFADTDAIALINRHAAIRRAPPTEAAPAVATSPSPSSEEPRG